MLSNDPIDLGDLAMISEVETTMARAKAMVTGVAVLVGLVATVVSYFNL